MNRKLSLLFSLALIHPVAWGGGLSLEEMDILSLSPAGGRWGDQFNTNIVYNPITNRVLTIVVDPGSGKDFRLVRFDASTNAFAGGAPLAGVPDVLQPIILGAEVSADGGTLLISWGEAGCGTEEDIPIQLEFFDLSSFVSSSTDIVQNIHLLRFDAMDGTNRFIGIAPPDSPDEPYAIIQVDAETREASPEMELDATPNDAFVKDVLFDSDTDRLLVLWVPTGTCAIQETPTECACWNTLQEGFVKAYDIVNDTASDPSQTIVGEFTRNSLALSPEARLVALAGKDSTTGTFVFQADTLDTVHSVPDSIVFGPSQHSLGSTVFGASDQIWLANESTTDSERSIAVYDIGKGTVDRYITDADLIIRMISDEETGKIFGASSRYQQIYVLSATATELTTRIDFTVGPSQDVALDMDVDTESNVFQVLSHAGGLHLVSDDGPTYLGRILDFAPDPKARLEMDPIRDRLFVGRRTSEPPLALETIGYQTAGELPLAADGLALDASQNLVYTTRVSNATVRVIEEVAGDSLAFIRQIAELSSALTPADMVVDEDREVLWALFKSFGYPLSLLRYDLGAVVQEASEEITGTFEWRGKLLLDAKRNRILVLPFSGNPAITSYALDQPDFEASRTTYEVPSSFIFDACLEPGEDVLYLLLQDSGSTTYTLAAADLESPTLAMETVELDFLFDSEARFARNPITDRFALLGGQSGRVYLFDNPFASTKKRVAKDLLIGSAEVVQTEAGIEIGWEISPQVPEGVRGVIVERRRTEAEPWIRLTPLPVPPSSPFWTDATVEPGEAYEYRLTSVGGGAPTSMVVSATASEGTRWIPDIPEVVAFLHPGETKSYLFSIGDRSGFSDRVMLRIEGDPIFGLDISPERIPVPGTAQFEISVPVDAAPGVYPVWVTADDGVIESKVQIVVRIVPTNQPLRADRILRRTTPISLTSDSELDRRRLSVRGQIGLLRRLANPVPITVNADLPDGSTQEAKVIASTGEFTADFSVPEGLDGDWFFEATFPGSFEAVGGRSRRFRFPVFASQGDGKGTGEFDIGQILLVTGAPPEGDDATDVSSVANDVLDHFERKRYKADIRAESTEIPNLFAPSSSKSEVVEAAGRLNTDEFALFYFVGDASPVGATGIEFELENGEPLTGDDIDAMVKSVRPRAVPLAIFDCPGAARLHSPLVASAHEGAFLFPAGPDWDPPNFSVVDRPDYLPFADNYLSFLEELGFGAAFDAYGGFFPAAGPRSRGLEWSEPARRGGKFFDFRIGSDFVLSTSTLGDRIVPHFLDAIPSGKYRVGEDLRIYAELADTPFEGDLRVRVLLSNEVTGSEEIVPLAKGGLSETSSAHIYEVTHTFVESGDFTLTFQAFDTETSFGVFTTSVRVCHTPTMDVHALLEMLRDLKSEDANLTQNDLALRLLGLGASWCP